MCMYSMSRRRRRMLWSRPSGSRRRRRMLWSRPSGNVGVGWRRQVALSAHSFARSTMVDVRVVVLRRWALSR